MRSIILFFSLSILPLYGWDLEVRSAGLRLQSDHFRKVYSNKIGEYQIEFACPLKAFFECCDLEELEQWAGWVNLSSFSKEGHFTYLHEKTKVRHWALNCGVKRYFCGNGCMHPYAGFGIGAVHARFDDHSRFVKQEIKLWGLAFLVKYGIEFNLPSCFYLDIFTDYAYSYMTKPHAKQGTTTRGIQTGGFKFGLGLGRSF
ncbi:MAG: hypothetical protein LW832_10165 [Parachlamydia sp.]|jgi:hypothetical protein|nr:hypothetical protein [Parachlamydia sp.]